jgi:hypothetical protein
MSSDTSKSPFERVAGPPLRLLTRFGGSEVAAKLGLRDATERLLHDVGLATGKLVSGKLMPRGISGRLAKAARRRGATRPDTSTATRPDTSAGARPDTSAATRPDTSAATRPDTSAASAVHAPVRLAPVPASPVFDLAPSEDQEMIRATARRFADEVMRPAAAAADQACAPDPAVLAAGHELALAALVVPEAFGGLAETRAAVTIALVAEELARGDLSLAVAMLAPIGAAGRSSSGGPTSSRRGGCRGSPGRASSVRRSRCSRASRAARRPGHGRAPSGRRAGGACTARRCWCRSRRRRRCSSCWPIFAASGRGCSSSRARPPG